MLLWIPRLIIKILGPRQRSSGTDTREVVSPKASRPTKGGSAMGTGGTSSHYPEPHPSTSPTPNAAELERIRRGFRVWVVLFMLVMLGCVVNVIILDVMWVKRGGFAAKTTVKTPSTSGNSTGRPGGSLGGSINVD
ncbi:uncharacterized protein SPPG_01411 [Spizellomyces punctatus DAOM BR117]|uniref:Uncharacterized protein n=1 Tax=Spizellomyces punctatus (strain DAOM BR117) TaxID=645134 RepID=A0A0L0HSV7_SPIPD|nr:uncharacterized protein SPPG_01411 [Spizellomyces punctatus DAOM BR117]KND03959.1 hypothetical protein SPPG_01411 [Spizellomyces punctatus DAOM BR117]|eukprot:XP_016611998.1 hypothetical protein SPPG_01411 [Spizellomyces punctatus DAOM BR117]